MLRKKVAMAFGVLALTTNLSYSENLDLKRHLAVYPDFPKEGVDFVDICSMLTNPELFHATINDFSKKFQNSGIDAIVAIESRGFIFASAMAYKLGLPLILARKPGKLPGTVGQTCYQKEYGKDCMEIQKHALASYHHILVVDDIYATGGTMQAVVQLLEDYGIKKIDLAVLGTVRNIPNAKKPAYPLYSLVDFD